MHLGQTAAILQQSCSTSLLAAPCSSTLVLQGQSAASTSSQQHHSGSSIADNGVHRQYNTAGSTAQPGRRTLRSGRVPAASAPTAKLVRRAFFLTTLPTMRPALLFLLLLATTTASAVADTSTVLPRLARPLYL
jgi:hypothetical protein